MAQRFRDCGWGAVHDAHAHPGLDGVTCPGRFAAVWRGFQDGKHVATIRKRAEDGRYYYGAVEAPVATFATLHAAKSDYGRWFGSTRWFEYSEEQAARLTP